MLGAFEPDDVQGWLEHGGGLALQLALRMTALARRGRLNGIAQRDGRGPLAIREGQAAKVMLRYGAGCRVDSFVVEELPAYLLEGALLLALAASQESVTLLVRGAPMAHIRLLGELLERMERYGITGEGGWSGVPAITLDNAGDDAGADDALDAVTTLLLPVSLWHGQEPPTTLLGIEGAVQWPGVYEVILGRTVGEAITEALGSYPLPSRVRLGDCTLWPEQLSVPLTFESFDRELGSSHLLVES
jgi:hypothetical protein